MRQRDYSDCPKLIPVIYMRWILGMALLVCGAAPLVAEEEVQGARTPSAYAAKGRRDPFAPLVRDGKLIGLPKDQTSGVTPVLYGILWDPAGPSIAMINDQEVRVGDTVGGYQVAEIRQDAVVLKGGGEPVVLQIDFQTPPSERSPRTATGGGVQ
jgi:hypothetical protein